MATFDLDFEGWNPGSLSIIVAQIVEYLENHPIYDPETGYTYSDLVAGNNLPAMVTDTELTQNEKENAYAAGYRFVYDTSLHEAYFLVKVNGILSVVDFPGNDFLDKADVIISSASGTVASFTDGADNMPMESVVCSIEPVQDLHGYDAPWVGGAGKNLINPSTNFSSSVTYSDGEYSFSTNGYVANLMTGQNGSSHVVNDLTKCPVLPPGDYVWSYKYISGGSASNGLVGVWAVDDDGNRTNTGATNDFDSDGYVCVYFTLAQESRICITRGTNTTPTVFSYPQLEAGTARTSWVPYENICPITGHTGLTLSHSDADTSNPTTYTIDWTSSAGTVYGGNYNWKTGKLTVTHKCAEIDPNSLVLVGTGAFYSAISDMQSGNNVGGICDKFPTSTGSNMFGARFGANNSRVYFYKLGTIGVTDLANAKTWFTNNPTTVCYPLANTIEYTLTAQQINSILGTNNLWHNANGNTSVSYRADTKLYIDAGLAGKQDTLTFDSAPVQNSTKPVTSGGLYTAFSAKQDTLTFDSAPVQSSTKPVTSGGLYTAFSAKQDTLTFDSAPVQNSTKPVTSGGLYTAFSAKQDALVFDQVPQTDSTHPVTSDGIKTALDLKADLPILEVRSYDFSLTIPSGGVGYTYTNEVSGYTCIGCRAVISSSSSPLIEVSCPVYISSQVQARILNIGSGSSNDIVGTMYFYFIKDSYIQ